MHDLYGITDNEVVSKLIIKLSTSLFNYGFVVAMKTQLL